MVVSRRQYRVARMMMNKTNVTAAFAEAERVSLERPGLREGPYHTAFVISSKASLAPKTRIKGSSFFNSLSRQHEMINITKAVRMMKKRAIRSHSGGNWEMAMAPDCVRSDETRRGAKGGTVWWFWCCSFVLLFFLWLVLCCGVWLV